MKTINESLKEAGFSDELLNAFNKLDYTDYQDDIIEDTCSDFNGSPIISSTTPQLNEHIYIFDNYIIECDCTSCDLE